MAPECKGQAGDSTLWDGPPGGRPFLLAHSAGGRNTSPWLATVAAGLGAGGLRVARFNFPYSDAGRKAPDRPPVLLEAWRTAAASLGGGRADAVLGGKSMGGRYATMLLAEPGPPPAGGVGGRSRPPAPMSGEAQGDAPADRGGPPDSMAAVLYGYPLHAPGRHDRLRREHLPAVKVPMLFLAGTRDAFARVDLLEETVAALGQNATLHLVEGADHDFKVRGRPQADVLAELVEVTLRFLD